MNTVLIPIDGLVAELRKARVDSLKSGKRVMHDGWIRATLAVANALDSCQMRDAEDPIFDKEQFLNDVGLRGAYEGSIDGSYSLPVSDRSLVYGGSDCPCEQCKVIRQREAKACSHCCGECQAQCNEFTRYENDRTAVKASDVKSIHDIIGRNVK